MGEFLDALREEVDPKVTLGIVVILGALVAFTDVSPFAAVAFAGVFALTAIVSALHELPGVKGRAPSATLFAFGTLCGLWLTLTEPSYVMGGFTVIVGWLALDALYNTIHGIERTEPRKSEIDEMGHGEANRAMYRAGQVGQALEKSPASLSVSELVTRTGLSENEVHEALSILEESGTVLEHRERYEIDEEQPGLVRSTARRLARPFSLFTPSR